MNERMVLIVEYQSGNYSLSELARRRGISRKTAYKWIERYECDGARGLEELSRAAHHHPNATSAEMEEAIWDWKERRPLWGAPKIHSKLRHLADCPAESTISNVLKRHGLTRRVRRPVRCTPSPGPLLVPMQPNEVWCADFKGWIRLGNGQRCDPLTLSDGFSRYLLCCRGLQGTQTGLVQPWFEWTFRRNGIPAAIRTDNGPPFASVGLGGLSPLSVWLMRLGIRLERIQPGHPEQNGRHERMHRTLKEATARPARENLQAQQRAFDRFVRDYNHDRPHEALGQQPPASVYRPSNRQYPSRLIEPEYPIDWQVRAVRSNGEIKWKGQKLYLSEGLMGQRIALEPVADGQWVVHFLDVELGLLDEPLGRVLRVQWDRQADQPSQAPPNGAPGAAPRTPADGSLRSGSRRHYPRLGPPQPQKV
jgi:transposase InsO family protein